MSLRQVRSSLTENMHGKLPSHVQSRLNEVNALSINFDKL